MSAPYGTLARIQTMLGADLTLKLTTLDATSVPADVYAQAREAADSEIEVALGQAYPPPYAGLSDVPPTHKLIQRISDLLTCANLFEARHPEGDDAKTYRTRAETLLARILSGEYELDGVPKASATDGRVGVSTAYVEGNEPLFAGYDADGVDRCGGY
ncbi:MAG: DUF1320 family protein [Deltaproteobacteria bacterium]|nr:DUF1320 family protein [Deltaproteobacteria bacterium]